MWHKSRLKCKWEACSLEGLFGCLRAAAEKTCPHHLLQVIWGHPLYILLNRPLKIRSYMQIIDCMSVHVWAENGGMVPSFTSMIKFKIFFFFFCIFWPHLPNPSHVPFINTSIHMMYYCCIERKNDQQWESTVITFHCSHINCHNSYLKCPDKML